MSRFYGMSVRISNHDPARADAIIEAAEEEWPFGDLTDNGQSLSGYGEDNLNAGCSEHMFAEEFAMVIWEANGAYCDVNVVATYLEDLPNAGYSLNRADYARLIGRAASTSSRGDENAEDHVDRGD